MNVLFYGPTFGTPFSKLVTAPGGRLTIVDVGDLRSEGLPAQPGVAPATGALAGNFAVANLPSKKISSLPPPMRIESFAAPVSS